MIGLGTSTSLEAKEYFTEMERHRIRFLYSGVDDDHFVQLAFSKKMVEQRKDWLTNSMEERKRRRELGLPEMYLYEKMTRSVTYKDFVNKELILFSNMDNERSIPSLVDGLKPGQRKVLYTCFKRNDKREVKVAQLAGSVGEHSAYHHGEVSLMSTIINLAQNFVGSNNVNLLQPIGQFGTRLQGGKDAASPRYIFTMLNPLARKLFSSLDDPLLNYLFDDNLKIEPEYYVPIIPMVLVNGAEGIGTGWSTKIPNYNPRDIVENIRRMMRGEEIKVLKPWFKGFRGSIEQLDTQRFVINGEAAILDSKSFEITELPIRVWTQTYKESVLEPLLNGSEKTPAYITDYKEYHTDTTVKFIVTLNENNLSKALDSGIHKTFKIQSSLSTTSMVLFDHNGCLKRYETPEDIVREFYPVRLDYYVKRKMYYEGILEAEALKLENQARFIAEKNDRILVMENIKRKDFIAQLIKRNYDSDPVKAWKKKNADKQADSSSDDEDYEHGFDKKYDFDYLIDMSMRSMLREKVEELMKQRDQKKTELQKLRLSTPEDLWEEDLKEFLAELENVEQMEREQMTHKVIKSLKTSKNNRSIKSARSDVPDFYKPSPDGERIIPKIDNELLKKTAAGVRKLVEKIADKEKSNSGDENGYVPLSERIGISPELIDKQKAMFDKPNEKTEKKEPKKKVSKPKDSGSSKKATSKGKGKKKSRNVWSESENESGSEEEGFLDVESSDENDYCVSKVKNGKTTETEAPKPKELFPKKNFDSDDDLFGSKPVPQESKKTSEELFDSLFSDSKPKSPVPERSETMETNNNHNFFNVDDDDDDVSFVAEKTKKPEKSKPKKSKKKKVISDSDLSDMSADSFKPKAAKKSKSKKKKKSSDSEEERPKKKVIRFFLIKSTHYFFNYRRQRM